MSDLTPKSPRTKPRTQKSVAPTTNPPINVEVSYVGGVFSYDPAGGNVVIYAKKTDPEEFMIYLKRKTGQKWTFVDGGFDWNIIGAAHKKNPSGTEFILKAESYSDDTLAIRDLVIYEGPEDYKYSFKIELEDGTTVTEDPEIQNNKELQARSSVTEH